MSETSKYQTTKEVVKNFLIVDEACRNDDIELIRLILNMDMAAAGIDPFRVSFDEAMKHFREWNLTPFETIRRSRQELQQKNPELRPVDSVEEKRELKEMEYHEMFREGTNG